MLSKHPVYAIFSVFYLALLAGCTTPLYSTPKNFRATAAAQPSEFTRASYTLNRPSSLVLASLKHFGAHCLTGTAHEYRGSDIRGNPIVATYDVTAKVAPLGAGVSEFAFEKAPWPWDKLSPNTQDLHQYLLLLNVRALSPTTTRVDSLAHIDAREYANLEVETLKVARGGPENWCLTSIVSPM